MPRFPLLATLLLSAMGGSMIARVDGCNVVVKVESLADEPFKFKIIIPAAGLETEDYVFEKGVRMMRVKVIGDQCYAKHWQFITWKRSLADAGSDVEWVKSHESVAKIDGHGEMLVSVLQDLKPVIGYRIGVSCSESLACKGG